MNEGSYRVLLRDNQTNEERWYTVDSAWEDEVYLWTEGNWSCDCNRHLFFYGDNENVDCGDERFSAPYAELPDGTRIVLDE